MQTLQFKNRPHYYFSNVNEFLEYVDPKIVATKGYGNNEVSQTRRETNWMRQWRGGLTYEGAHQMAKLGAFMSPALLTLRDKMVSAIRPNIEQTCYMDVTGGSQFDIGAVLSGIPECVYAYRDETANSRKTISLIYNFCASAGVSEQILRWRGIAFLALVDAIETSKRYRTNVYLACDNNGGGGVRDHVLIVKAKGTDAPYDPQALGFTVGHPAMLRCLAFGFYEIQFGVNCHSSMGMPGSCYELPTELGESEAMATEGAKLGDYVNTDAIHDERSAMMWVIDQLENYGITCLGIEDHTV